MFFATISALYIIKPILIVLIFTFSLVTAMYSTYAERKVAAFLQDRIGPNRAGIFGLLQPLADGFKMFFKEEIVPRTSDKFLFFIAPVLFIITALMTSAVIPWSNDLQLFGETIVMQVTDLNIGILYVVGVVSLGVYGIMIGGWASNNKYSLLGAIRASSQMISYELAMGIAILSIVIMTGGDNPLSLREIADYQANGNLWNVFKQPITFLIFFICAMAECNRAPFDLPECETELVGGFHTEYSSMKLGFFLFAEYINMAISSAIISLLFFGGYHLPFEGSLGLTGNTLAFAQLFMFFIKISFFIFLFMWIRWTLPRFRFDQLMKLGWYILIPAAILNLVFNGGLKLFGIS